MKSIVSNKRPQLVWQQDISKTGIALCNFGEICCKCQVKRFSVFLLTSSWSRVGLNAKQLTEPNGSFFCGTLHVYDSTGWVENKVSALNVRVTVKEHSFKKAWSSTISKPKVQLQMLGLWLRGHSNSVDAIQLDIKNDHKTNRTCRVTHWNEHKDTQRMQLNVKWQKEDFGSELTQTCSLRGTTWVDENEKQDNSNCAQINACIAGAAWKRAAVWAISGPLAAHRDTDTRQRPSSSDVLVLLSL